MLVIFNLMIHRKYDNPRILTIFSQFLDQRHSLLSGMEKIQLVDYLEDYEQLVTYNQKLKKAVSMMGMQKQKVISDV